MSEKVLILGGDGFCGWPTSLYLSNEGYDVTIVDNLSRRKIDIELECESLTPIKPIGVRLEKWHEMSGKQVHFVNLDVSLQYNKFRQLIHTLKPNAIVHFAEQRAAPYSMKSPFHKRYTVNNNINATHNTLCAIAESGLDIHLVHLGTMGVYGYGTAGVDIPEGYLNVKVEVDDMLRDLEILYPANPGSVYHMTKTQDALMFYFYNKNDGLRITDLHQGVVWGTNIDETLMHSFLINRFDYDGDFGTVLNRFLVQAAAKHPLTVHGSGGQTRAFIHIRDTVQCIKLAIENPPQNNERVNIFNQATETHSVVELAQLVAGKTGAEIRYYINPRNEDNKNTLLIKNEKFLELGLNPIQLCDGLIDEVYSIAKKYIDRCDMSKIICTSRWNKNILEDFSGQPNPIK